MYKTHSFLLSKTLILLLVKSNQILRLWKSWLNVTIGIFFRMIQNGDSPKNDEKITGFLNIIRETTEILGNRVFVIAGADLAHVGLKFGDPEPVSQSTLTWIKQRDLLSLSFT